MADLNKITGISKLRTTPYHPQSNGACERMNQTLLKMLRTLPESQKSRWPEAVNKMVYSYNCTQHSSTGYSPYFLLFGREPNLPIDVILGTQGNQNEYIPYNKFAKEWQCQMKEAYKIARKNSVKKKIGDQDRWCRRKLLAQLRVGDRVLLQNKKQRGGPGKLRAFWEPVIYVVKSVKGEEGVVYEICKQSDGSGTRIVHRNMLLPVDEEFEIKDSSRTEEENMERCTSNNRTKGVTKKRKHNLQKNGHRTIESDDSDNDLGYYPNQLQGYGTLEANIIDENDISNKEREGITEVLCGSDASVIDDSDDSMDMIEDHTVVGEAPDDIPGVQEGVENMSPEEEVVCKMPTRGLSDSSDLDGSSGSEGGIETYLVSNERPGCIPDNRLRNEGNEIHNREDRREVAEDGEKQEQLPHIQRSCGNNLLGGNLSSRSRTGVKIRNRPPSRETRNDVYEARRKKAIGDIEERKQRAHTQRFKDSVRQSKKRKGDVQTKKRNIANPEESGETQDNNMENVRDGENLRRSERERQAPTRYSYHAMGTPDINSIYVDNGQSNFVSNNPYVDGSETGIWEADGSQISEYCNRLLVYPYLNRGPHYMYYSDGSIHYTNDGMFLYYPIEWTTSYTDIHYQLNLILNELQNLKLNLCMENSEFTPYNT